MRKLFVVLALSTIGLTQVQAQTASAGKRSVNLDIRIALNDTYSVTNAILLEGIERSMSGSIEVQTADGSGTIAMDNMAPEKLSSTMLIVKSKNAVTFMEKGAETYNATFDYDSTGTLQKLVLDHGQTRSALQKDVKEIEKQMIEHLKQEGQDILGVSADISDYVCTRVAKVVSCQASVEVFISILTDDIL